MRPLFAIPAVLALAACVDTLAQREAALAPTIGMTESQLVQALGVPSRAIDADGKRFLAYRDQQIQVVPGTMMWGGWGYPWGYGGGFPPEVITRVCETTFTLVDGKVQGFTLRGNSC